MAQRFHAELADRQATRRLLRRAILTACVVLIAYVVSVMTVITIKTRYVVTVFNEASLPAESLVVYGGGVREEFGRLAPGERRSRSVWFREDGELEVEGTVGGRPVHGMVEGYVTSGQGGRADVRIAGDGSVAVTHERNSHD